MEESMKPSWEIHMIRIWKRWVRLKIGCSVKQSTGLANHMKRSTATVDWHFQQRFGRKHMVG
eukprot:11543847-Prorocentrum_lima.AAC.1